MSITDLLKKADKAFPPVKSRTAWRHLLPVVDKLSAERGFTLLDAVDWLVNQKAVPAEKRMAAYHSLNGSIRRRRSAS